MTGVTTVPENAWFFDAPALSAAVTVKLYGPALGVPDTVIEAPDVVDVSPVEGPLEGSTVARLATIACHSVIRANRQLEMTEMRALLRELDQVEFATQCPHGRPVLLEFSRDDLEKMFKRVV